MKTVPLGQVADFVNGFAFKPSDWHEDGLPIVRIQNLTDHSKPINRTTRPVDSKFVVRRGELLVSWSATLGVFEWKRTDEALVNQHIFRVIPRKHVEVSYLRHMLADALVAMERHIHGATMKHVNRREFLATEIPLPSFDEQRRIAAILDHADALRAKRRQVLAHLDSLTQSIFHDMFVTSSATAWEHVALETVVNQIDSGTSPNCESRQASAQEWGVLKLGAVTYGSFRASENKAYLGEIGSMVTNEVKNGDVLMTRKNTRELVGAVALVDDVRPRLLLPDLVFRLHLDTTRVNRRYFQALMMSPLMRSSVRNLSSGSAASMPNISKTRLRKFRVPLPPKELQDAFSDRIGSLRAESEKHVAALAGNDELFFALQSRAFSGQL